ncbi:Maf family protein [Marinomonas aquiplantarum]|uniref:7-methyl-GTP pyrophosphatase n=1 Tax=Marinomonas aquiplantarum TaxID=491951 RepID=A0A366D0J0_9GAMM|nr:Maf family protein [Marinomonas aquiplantarum]RBO82788.1 MAF protein [Marinomonas aquiplantarum]
MQKNIILGSSSPYRKALLERLQLTFECLSPDINEEAHPAETPQQLVARLSIEKAEAVAKQLKEQKTSADEVCDIIITSDQVAVLDGVILGKPHTHQKAIQQLTKFSGRKVSFLTGLCVYNSITNNYEYSLSQYDVHFRSLSDTEIKHYIEIEQPLDCAGSFKCEGLGVTLFEKMAGNDPNSLIGLPLIELCRLLRNQGINPLEMSDKSID